MNVQRAVIPMGNESAYGQCEDDSSEEEEEEEERGGRRVGCIRSVVGGCYGCFYGCYFCNCCCACILAVFLTIGAINLAQIRNYNCNAGGLEGITPPYGGQLLPTQVVLKEYWNQGFQYTKRIDVYDPNKNMSHIGYFYDMNLLFFMRFGYSDANDRIWFEAKRPWFYGGRTFSEYWRRSVYDEDHYYLQECRSGNDKNVYHIDEDTSVRPWWCKHECMKVLNTSKQLPNSLVPAVPEARVHFNYTLEWYFSGFKTRQAWNMLMTDPTTKRTIASAQQYFTLKNYFMSWTQRYVSHWNVNITSGETNLPNWVVVFMAALDDIDESSESGKEH